MTLPQFISQPITSHGHTYYRVTALSRSLVIDAQSTPLSVSVLRHDEDEGKRDAAAALADAEQLFEALWQRRTA